MADFNFVTNRVATGAAITTEEDVQALVDAGVTHVIDCRNEFDDAPLLATHPAVSYLYDGVPDDGQPKPTEWFQKGIEFALDALSRPHTKVYAHCACFIPGTMVGSTMPSPIESINRFDKVLSSDGESHSSISTMSRHYNGEIRTIATKAIPDIQCTPEHPFLVLKPYRSGSKRIFTPGIQKYFSAVDTYYTDIEPEWCLASDLEVGDYLLSPRIQFSEEENLETSMPSARELNIGDDLPWLIGLYAGDGSSGNKQINWTLHKNNNIDRFNSAVKEMGLSAKTYKYENYQRTFIHSTYARENFRGRCGVGGLNKHLPPFVYSNKNWAKEALDGLLEADGSYSPRENRVSFSSISRTMAWQVWHLAVSFGFRPSIHNIGISKDFKTENDTYTVRWSASQNRGLSLFWDNYYCIPITDINNSTYSGNVYNLQVDKTENYLANGIIAHNCGINRGPSMCYAILLAQGIDPNTAENLMRARRPQVGIAYKLDAQRAVAQLGYIDSLAGSAFGEIER